MSSLIPVRGTHDLFGQEILKHNYIVDVARRVSLSYGCQEISTPIFEFTNVFSRTLGDVSDIVNKEMYTFSDRSNEEITLRPEGTAGIARAYLSNGLAQLSPLKLFYHGPMFRYERPQKGRQRQFHQVGIEMIGVASYLADVEVISLAYNFLQKLRLNSTRLEINTIGDSESRKNYRENLVNYLQKYASDLSEDSQRRLKANPLRILDSKDKKDKDIVSGAPILTEALNENSKIFYDNIKESLAKMNIPFTENSHLVRGLDYYCHCVFEFKSDELGAQDTVLAGGRYDGLIQLMGGPSTPAVGFASGIERLSLLLSEEVGTPRPIALIPLGEAANDFCTRLAHRLRADNFVIEMSYSGNMSKRMKKANAKNAQLAVIIGDEELKKNEATVKNLDTGAQVQMNLDQLDQQIQSFLKEV